MKFLLQFCLEIWLLPPYLEISSDPELDSDPDPDPDPKFPEKLDPDPNKLFWIQNTGVEPAVGPAFLFGHRTAAL